MNNYKVGDIVDVNISILYRGIYAAMNDHVDPFDIVGEVIGNMKPLKDNSDNTCKQTEYKNGDVGIYDENGNIQLVWRLDI